jgi:sulfite exporter TauE/SafE
VQARFAAAFLIGLVGGVHCIGMCGGIAVALVAGFGVAGLARAADLGERIRQGLLCII